jgi:hypothetical protein
MVFFKLELGNEEQKREVAPGVAWFGAKPGLVIENAVLGKTALNFMGFSPV